MRIQTTNTHYTGSYSVLNIKNGSAFPYAMRVDGYGNSRNGKSLFDFATAG